MLKRSFRSRARNSADYPVEAAGRRGFLRGLLGVVALGAGGAWLQACGDGRAVSDASRADGGKDLYTWGGAADGMPSWLDDASVPDLTSTDRRPDGLAAPLDNGHSSDASGPKHDATSVPDGGPAADAELSSDGMPQAD